jgi:spermidine synthase
MPKFAETLYDSFGQEFRIDELLYEVKTEHQHVVIFHNASFGRVLALDGIVQTTEKDEFIYHEMLTHVPVLAHGSVRRVLIIGGGDGGILREVAKHAMVNHITQVEIDQQVIDMCRKYLPQHSAGAFDDPRARIVIGDGLAFVSGCQEQFDVIISDSTDPIGPGAALFREDFYAACRRCLSPGGVLVTQNGVAYMQLDEVRTSAQRLSRHFEDWHFYAAAIPTYIGGIMTFGWATSNPALRHVDLTTLKARLEATGLKLRYYNPEVHMGAFALPQYVVDAIGKKDNEYH